MLLLLQAFVRKADEETVPGLELTKKKDAKAKEEAKSDKPKKQVCL